jgi:signal transduction histidine kinase
MASGIAHDINNAISPMALSTELLLETESELSPRTRKHLQMMQQATDDVAKTVARMKDFYRQREPQLILAPVDMNALVQQVVDLTRARWMYSMLGVRLSKSAVARRPDVIRAELANRTGLSRRYKASASC